MSDGLEVLRLLFNFQDRDLGQAVAVLKEAFSRTTTDAADGFCGLNQMQWRAKDRKKHAALNAALASESGRVGVDLPWMLSCVDPKKTVMILGQDPLRNLNDFSAAEKWKGRIIVGTPYAVHSTFYRERTKTYRLIFDELRRIGCNVYLTDALKLYTGSYLSVDALDREVVRQEVESVNPDLIVCFGNSSLHVLTFASQRGGPISRASIKANNTIGGIPILSVLHPGGNANRYWRTLLGERPASSENKANYILDCIKMELAA